MTVSILRAPVRAGILLAMVLGFTGVATANTPSSRVLDDFSSLESWEAKASSDVKSSIASAEGKSGQALRLDFDFAGVSGYAYARRDLPLDLPENYEISFNVRADAPVNTFEIKLADASGDNVWWHQRRDYAFPAEWQRIKIKKRHISFAWGPTANRTLRHSQRLEFVVVAGKGGGKGSIYVDDLQIRELPADNATPPTPVARATSSMPGQGAENLFTGSTWSSDPAAGPKQSLDIDLHTAREFGGLVLRWADGAHASRYDVLASDDGATWQTLRRVEAGDGGNDALMLPEAEARYLRLDLHDGPKGDYALAGIDIKELAFGASPNAFFAEMARGGPRGRYPRGITGEQSYWTIVGVDGGGETGLLGEDGAIEVGKGQFSIEPFVVADGKLVTWADVKSSQSLTDGYLPIPGVTWDHPRFELQVTAFASGSREQSRLMARYAIRNTTAEPQTLKLALAARPFQVNPPSQSLNIHGGVSPVTSLAWDGQALSVNGRARVVPLVPPQSVTATTFDSGSYPDLLLSGTPATANAVSDATGFASGALIYDVALAPGETKTIGFVAPLAGPLEAPELAGKAPEAWLEAEQTAIADIWREKLNHVRLDVPAEGQRLVDTLRTSLAHILITRDGPILQPGTRSYSRSWIRDGAMMSESLVRLGHASLASDYLRWFAPYQFKDGKVPCCVDQRGADPVPENDSHGQLIFLAAEIYRYTGDRALLESVWPAVNAAARYMDGLRATERTEKNLAPDRRMLYGLLPPSISHEGYAHKPAYSYWDGFWGLRGYKDAIAIANALGHTDDARRIEGEHNTYRQDLFSSLRAASQVHDIGYLPGAADLGDFDATSTTIALAPGGERENLPDDLLKETFERYWRNFTNRRDGRESWNDYTPYELRSVGTFVRLGWRERTMELLDFFFKDQRPQAWNQWAEVVGRDPRQPRFIGDMPHAWISSDYIRSVLDMFVYARESDQALVVGAGVPTAWLEGRGIAVTGLRTQYGTLSYSLRSEGSKLILSIGGNAKPPGGFKLRSPDSTTLAADQNGQAVTMREGELHVASAPAEIVIERQE